MNWGKSGAGYYQSHMVGSDAKHIGKAVREYVVRDNPDVVTFFTRPQHNTGGTATNSWMDVPGYTAVNLSPNAGRSWTDWDRDSREKLLSIVLFNKKRFSQSDSSIGTLLLSNDYSFTNCTTMVAELIEKDTGAKVKVVGVFVSSTAGANTAGSAAEQGFSTLISKLDDIKDEKVVLLLQGWDADCLSYIDSKINSELSPSYSKLGQYTHGWPDYQYQSAWATANCQASAEQPAPLNLGTSNTYTNQSFCATVLFDELPPEPVVEYGQLDMSAFSKRMTVAFPGVQSGVALTNFPVLVKLSEAIDGSAQPSGADIANIKLKASTDKANPIDYAVGETIRFDFRLDGVETLPVTLHDRLPLCVVWERTGDDGLSAQGTNTISLAQGCSIATSLAFPGFVRIEAHLAGSDGRAITYMTSGGDTASITFSGGAGVATDEMSLSAEEPADFDAFWHEAKSKLAAIPFPTDGSELTEVFPTNASAATLGAYRFYAAKIPCLGPRPVTGWLVVPKNAQPGSLSVRATFAGYGCATTTPNPPNWGSPTEIRFEVNAHGYELVGQNDQYYRDFSDSINKTNRTFDGTTYTYGLAPQDYANPTNTYFYYMALRVVRAFDYLKSRPEWDGTNVVAEGGSQGGLQTMWAGGLVDGISRIKPSITWGCDIGCPFNGQGQFVSRTWGILCVSGAYYFDAALHAKRVPIACTASIERIGMGDYTCPPRGVILSYYGMKCPVTANLVQGSTHGYVPPQTNQTFLISKAATADIPVAATEAEGYDWTNRLFTVSGLEAGATVTLTLTTGGASSPSEPGAVTAVCTADASGSVSFSPATIAGALYAYAFFTNGVEFASGSFLAGGWDAIGAWFSAAPDGAGGSAEVGGSWTLPPEGTNATAYVVGDATAFSLDAAASAAGTGKVVRAEIALRYDFLNDASDTFSDLSLGDSLAAITAVTNSSAGGAAQWKACAGGTWIALDGAIAPAPDTDYLVRLEGDFAAATPRVRLSVSDDGGASYASLSSAATGDEWLVPNNAAATALTGITTDGAANVAVLRGQLSNAWVAETGGVRYASLAEALRAAGRGGTVTLLTSATAPASLAAGRTIIGNGHIFVTYDDWHGTLFFMQ